MENLVYLYNSVHKDQLRALLKKCGYEVTPETFRNLKKDAEGRYTDTLFKITNNKAIGLSPEETEEQRMTPGIKHLHEILGPKIITDIRITDTHPITGLQAPDKGAYLMGDINGIEMTTMPIGKTLYNQYQRGYRTAQEIASSIFRDVMLEQYRVVITDVDYGRRCADGKDVIYYSGNSGEGAIYKDMNAFDEKEGICYISSDDWQEYIMDRVCVSRKLKDMSEYGVTYDDIVSHARTLALRNPEKVARQCLLNCTRQSIYTELQEFHFFCETEDILGLDEYMVDLYDLFNEQHGMAPNYAEVYVNFKDNRTGFRTMIALNDKAGEYADDEVIFTCSNMDEFYKLAEDDNGEDFKVTELCGYHRGMMDIEQKIAMEADNEVNIDSRDNGATIFETETHLPRITNIRVYLNSQNKANTEFRMRCKIDGIQQLGKVLKPEQVEELANGANRAQIASIVFSKELKDNLNNQQARGQSL